jgi:hypothetical protein
MFFAVSNSSALKLSHLTNSRKLQLDRGNIAQALSDNMLSNLHINTNNYNTGQTIFYLTFLTAEIPS